MEVSPWLTRDWGAVYSKKPLLNGEERELEREQQKAKVGVRCQKSLETGKVKKWTLPWNFQKDKVLLTSFP